MSDIDKLPVSNNIVRNKRVNDIDTLIAKTNTNIVLALDRIVEIMNDPEAKRSDVLNASAKYVQYYILFRDKKQDWEDRELKRELLKLNLKQRSTTKEEVKQEFTSFDINYRGENDEFLKS